MTDRYTIVFEEIVSQSTGKTLFNARLVDAVGEPVGSERVYGYGYSHRHAVKELHLNGLQFLYDPEMLKEAKRACRRWLWSEKNRVEVMS